jgi:predicted nucleotidyltransferase component of viral defense system
MIPRAHIVAWRKSAPWKNNEQVEQDLVISRFLVDIFSDSKLSDSLAFRGGTAIHKLYLKPQARYSEDIDLVQTRAGPIGEIFDRLRKMSFVKEKVKTEQKERNSVCVFFFDSEISPVIRLKVRTEINCREHASVFGIKEIPFKIATRWFTGECDIKTYELEELLGSKMRALYQRKKGRDLFDLWHALSNAEVSIDRIITAFHSYMTFAGCSVSRKEFTENMTSKLCENEFRNDTAGLIRPEIEYDIDSAWRIVSERLVARI